MPAVVNFEEDACFVKVKPILLFFLASQRSGGLYYDAVGIGAEVIGFDAPAISPPTHEPLIFVVRFPPAHGTHNKVFLKHSILYFF
jgi:hypothetical protein